MRLLTRISAKSLSRRYHGSIANSKPNIFSTGGRGGGGGGTKTIIHRHLSSTQPAENFGDDLHVQHSPFTSISKYDDTPITEFVVSFELLYVRDDEFAAIQIQIQMY